MAKTAGILIIGNEVLSGKVVDQNSPYLVQELRSLGVDVQRITTIPDDVSVIVEEVQTFARRYDLVFTTGGVGPTHDDVTIPAIAQAFGCAIVRHPALEEVLLQHYGQGITAAQLRMAEVPEGGKLVGEGELAFPVVAFQNVYIFPGIPEVVHGNSSGFASCSGTGLSFCDASSSGVTRGRSLTIFMPFSAVFQICCSAPIRSSRTPSTA